jgi:hypothetical protein
MTELTDDCEICFAPMGEHCCNECHGPETNCYDAADEDDDL